MNRSRDSIKPLDNDEEQRPVEIKTMRIMNRSQKNIDNIAPLQIVEIDKVEATKLKTMYGDDIEIVIEGQETETLKTVQKNLKATIKKMELEKKELQEYVTILKSDNKELKEAAEAKKAESKKPESKKNVPPAPPK